MLAPEGVDIGKHSIGWALLDNDKILSAGVRIFPAPLLKKKKKKRRKSKIKASNNTVSNTWIYAFLSILLITTLVTVFFQNDWKYWLNIAIAFLIALLSLLKK